MYKHFAILQLPLFCSYNYNLYHEETNTADECHITEKKIKKKSNYNINLTKSVLQIRALCRTMTDWSCLGLTSFKIYQTNCRTLLPIVGLIFLHWNQYDGKILCWAGQAMVWSDWHRNLPDLMSHWFQNLFWTFQSNARVVKGHN